MEIKQAIKHLNKLIEIDPDAICDLINQRVPCNEKIADGSCRAQAFMTTKGLTLGVVGLLNAVLAGEDDLAVIAVKGDINEKDEFTKIHEFIDLR